MRARGAPSASAWRHGAGAKSWALARVRQAADRGQEHRYTGRHHRRNVPRSLEGGKAPAKLGRPWAEAKWSESRLGCLADWLQASWQLGRGHPGRSSRSQVGSPWGCPSPPLPPGRERQAAHMPPTACTQAPAPSPSLQLLDGVLVKALPQAQYGDIWSAGGGGKRELEQSAQILDHSRPPPSPRPGLDAGTGERDADRPALVEVGVSLSERAQHPNP